LEKFIAIGQQARGPNLLRCRPEFASQNANPFVQGGGEKGSGAEKNHLWSPPGGSTGIGQVEDREKNNNGGGKK